MPSHRAQAHLQTLVNGGHIIIYIYIYIYPYIHTYMSTYAGYFRDAIASPNYKHI